MKQSSAERIQISYSLAIFLEKTSVDCLLRKPNSLGFWEGSNQAATFENHLKMLKIEGG